MAKVIAKRFQKGMKKIPISGRKKGVRNRTTTLLKDAILEAATLVGQDGRGKGGLVGYLKTLAVKEKAVYARLLEKVLPMQLQVEDKTDRRYTAAEAVERLKERGLPVPPSLLAIAGPTECAITVAAALKDIRGGGAADPSRHFTQDDEDYGDIDADADEDSSRDDE